MTKRLYVSLFLSIVGLSLTLHLIYVNLTPSDWDDYVYQSVAVGTVETGAPSLRVNPGEQPTTFFYQPFWHFYLMAIWFDATNNQSIETARFLQALIAALTIAAIMSATRQITGSQKAALLAGLLLATDGWFTYSSGLIKLDTASVCIGLVGLNYYHKALEGGDDTNSYKAGLLLGFSSIYKHIAVFVLLAVALNYWRTRSKHRVHLIVISLAVVIIIVFFVTMALLIGDPYIQANIVQLKRATGFQQARGLNYDLSTVLQALGQIYYVFSGSLLVIAISVVVGVVDLIKTTLRWQEDDSVRAPALLSRYVFSAKVILVSVRLRNPHYLVLLNVPSCMKTAMHLTNWIRIGGAWKKFAYVLIAVVIFLNITTLVVRLSFSGKDAFAYATEAISHLPYNAVIMSEQPICQKALPSQICIQFDLYARVKDTTPPIQYIVDYNSFSQLPPDRKDIQSLIANSTELIRFGNWNNGWIVIREVNRQ